MVALMDMNEPATTWTKVAVNIQSSLWPTILRSDSTTSDGVSPGIRAVAKMGALSTLLLSLASMITPLGLYESIAMNSRMENVEFSYAKDTSVFGDGTLPRPAEGLSRLCGAFQPVACPESGSTIVSSANSTGFTVSDRDVIRIDVPSGYKTYLTSGFKTIGPMVASMFDIGYRTYSYSTDVRQGTINGGKKYGSTAGCF